MIVINTPISPYLQNAPIVYCDKTKKSIFVDPGDEAEKLVSVSEELNLKPEFILITHGHIDHAGAAVELAHKYNLEIIGPHKDDKFLLDTLEVQGQMYGVKAKNFIPDRWLTHNDSIEFADFKLQILHCPGHSPGHIVAINHESKQIIGGDILFNGSIGRSDLPMGNHQDLIKSIKEHFLTLDDDYDVYCGHGPNTTIGHERLTNPFLTNA